MIDYNKVLFIVATITLALNLLYIFKIGVQSGYHLDRYVCAKLDYLEEIENKVSLTPEFVCEYLAMDFEDLNDKAIEEMIYSDSFVEKYNLRKSFNIVVAETSMYNKALKKEEVLFNVVGFLMVIMAGLSIGLIILNF